MIRVKRMGHLALNSGDLARAEKFYAGLFGLKVSRRTDRELFLRCGADYLTIRELPARKEGYLPTPEDETGLDHLGLAVAPEEFDAALAEVKAAGVRVTRGPISHNGGGRSFYCLDPDGNRVEVWDEA
jgi:catechol 2,3-dioxygenase-like lactoylglutathione lyase family enzyme